MRAATRTVILVLLLGGAALVGVTAAAAAVPAVLPDDGGPAPPSTPPPTRPTPPAGVLEYAAGPGPVLGTAGALRRFQVAVEGGTGEDPAAFAATVDAVLGDGRSWVASGRLRLQRVPPGAPHEFTIYLASPMTSTRMCAAGGLRTAGFTSCRLPGKVIINHIRWTQAVPGYGAPLDVYRAYAINHEVGHQLGYGHETCPGADRPAPVMQQQTLGLRGCTAYAWPYLDGRRYTGARVP